jgi:hypothetical protein
MIRQYKVDEVRQIINQKQPKLIFLGGKTCTGKTTFANSLVPIGYQQIELDPIVRKYVSDKYKLEDQSIGFNVYKGNAPPNWQKSFEDSSHRVIKNKLKKIKVVVDAAIADVDVLKRIFHKELEKSTLIFFHPFDEDFYVHSIFNRFDSDLKNNRQTFPIWEFITTESVDDYTKNGESGKIINNIIKNYAKESTLKSEKRYEKFKNEFPNILLTGH